VSQDGIRWQLIAATEQVGNWPLVFASFPIHHFTPRGFQEINVRSFAREKKKLMEEKPSCEYLSDEFVTDSFSTGILMVYF
jgi:hypothetical protein